MVRIELDELIKHKTPVSLADLIEPDFGLTVNDLIGLNSTEPSSRASATNEAS